MALKKIISFLKTEEKFLFLRGTHQHKKHTLTIKTILKCYSQATILFRINNMNNADGILSPLVKQKENIKTGKPLKCKDGNKLYLDSINSQSWGSSPQDIDFGIIYPLDSLGPDKGSECIEDLKSRNAKKIFLVSSTDDKDFSWIEHYDPVPVVYDAEDEKPKYHQRVKELIDEASREQKITNLPNYAKEIENKYLVQIRCKNCNCTRWAKLNTPYPGRKALLEDTDGEYTAECLKCGEKVSDHHNWHR